MLEPHKITSMTAVLNTAVGIKAQTSARRSDGHYYSSLWVRGERSVKEGSLWNKYRLLKKHRIMCLNR